MSQLDEDVREHAHRMSCSGVAALGALFDLTSARLVRLAVAITRNQHDAEDAVQAALLRVANNPGLLAKADQPWPYLLRMVRNEALLTLRRKKKAYPLANLSDLITHCTVDQAEQEEQFQLGTPRGCQRRSVPNLQHISPSRHREEASQLLERPRLRPDLQSAHFPLHNRR